ncbi:hypothetical protein FEM48_Zijuj02G0098900 [Ziziphus jujuba var. spinosa]|uniref:Uncharacterized protein n=1 Tax=Ziziphus jujuba var. spinosa TaxID=714518 RepID=A0A978VV27_ZIZJJ|nr:hypothetical protein FEM48_Zijuj02G0098900 [Ziziphus jujuba var. spinosa]
MYDMLWEFRQTEFLVAIDDNGIVVHSTHRYSDCGCLFIDKLVNLNAMLLIFKKSLNLLNDMDFKGMENGHDTKDCPFPFTFGTHLIFKQSIFEQWLYAELPIQCPHEVSNWLLGMDDAMEVDDGHDLALVPYGVSSSNAYSGGSNGSHIPMQFGSLCLGHLGPILSMLRVGLGGKSKSNVQLRAEIVASGAIMAIKGVKFGQSQKFGSSSRFKGHFDGNKCTHCGSTKHTRKPVSNYMAIQTDSMNYKP